MRLGLLVLSLRKYEYVCVRIVSEWEKDLLFSLCFAQSGVRKLACGRMPGAHLRDKALRTNSVGNCALIRLGKAAARRLSKHH